MSEIKSDVIEINKTKNISTEYITEILTRKFKDVVRWAVVQADGEKLKISVSYRN